MHTNLTNGATNGVTYGTNDTDISLERVSSQLQAKLAAFLAADVSDNPPLRRVQEQTRSSLAVIDQALDRYSFAELSFSYNGGKDCLVLLMLYLASIGQRLSHTRPPRTLHSIYIISPHPFTEIDAFVRSSAATYALEIKRYASPMQSAFEAFLHDEPGIKAIFVGTRRNDPHGEKLSAFDPTDRGWPAFMRIHPVLDWRYADIWVFLRHFAIPYCELYDQGYTSLGGMRDTHPNPALLVKAAGKGGEETEGEKYLPAYELVDEAAERLGRF
ncbi:MAG: 3'-phosphoadenosine 5'-phosphosulfate sulfotransferase [Trizodia sp. TS-e1964]|nr:MAG: 3'-phosphoadenosine 5'-phosphosulfate sulfotransferase [Trizodia sp. TS-e1964]